MVVTLETLLGAMSADNNREGGMTKDDLYKAVTELEPYKNECLKL